MSVRLGSLVAALFLMAMSFASPAQAQGAVCGDRNIVGEPVGYLSGESPSCSVENAVRVSSINGINLSKLSVMDCTTAKALRTWIDKGVRKAIRKKGGGISLIYVAAHYDCRPRNGEAGAKMSEHGKGRAIDISGFRLRDGSIISVEDHWGRGKYGRVLKKMHRKACGPFRTVLGPDADSHHRDHFHLDTARDRSRTYCK